MRTARAVTKEVFTAHDIHISVDQWVLLKRIAEVEGLTQKEVADSTFKEPAAVTRMLKHMQQAGWIKKEADQADLRKYHLYLTPEGKALYDKALPLVKEMRNWALEDLEPAEQHLLRSLLKRVHTSLSQHN